MRCLLSTQFPRYSQDGNSPPSPPSSEVDLLGAALLHLHHHRGQQAGGAASHFLDSPCQSLQDNCINLHIFSIFCSSSLSGAVTSSLPSQPFPSRPSLTSWTKPNRLPSMLGDRCEVRLLLLHTKSLFPE